MLCFSSALAASKCASNFINFSSMRRMASTCEIYRKPAVGLAKTGRWCCHSHDKSHKNGSQGTFEQCSNPSIIGHQPAGLLNTVQEPWLQRLLMGSVLHLHNPWRLQDAAAGVHISIHLLDSAPGAQWVSLGGSLGNGDQMTTQHHS